MKMTKLTAMALILALGAGAISGCGDADSGASDDSETTASQTEAAVSDGKYTASSEYVKALGRTYLDEDVLWLGYSGSGAAYTFTGTKCTVTVKGDSTATQADYADGYARIAIYVNGERVVDDMVNEAEKVYTVIESDTETTAEIKIVKLSESANSLCGIGTIEADGEIAPAAEKKYKIEFIGDSITCGYGVDDEDRDHHFSTTTEDVTKTYAYKTCENLDADYSMVSLSGHGIISGYSDGKTQQKNQIMPKYYDSFGFSYGTFGSGKKAADIEWDHSSFVPDVVVINLGTNDASWCGNEEDRLMDYLNSYKEFIGDIREDNPDAYILCTLGIMGDSLYPFVEEAVNQYTAESGDTKVSSMKFDVQNQNDGYAADWHPTEATHGKAAEKLTAEIKAVMGW
ncbi:MAG: SGNH/GDSL hydrolase family protein [Huintestinicola sp.]